MQAAWPRAGHEAVSADQEVVAINRVPELEAKVCELEGLLGRKTMETEILCEVLEHARPETQVAFAVATTGRFLFRLMRYASLLLQLHTGRWPTRTPEAIVIVPASNRCWALNGLESPCWKSEVVRFAFVIDTHDHEIITLVAISSGSISGEMILDLMLDCIECRFDAIRTPQPVSGSPTVAFPTPLPRRPTSPPRSTSSCASRRFAAPKATASAKPSSNPSSAAMPG